MTPFIWFILALALLGIGLFVWALCAAAAKPAPEQPQGKPTLGYPWWLGGERQASPAPVVPVKAKRVYGRGLCPYCGETDIPLRADGEPHRRFHRCESSRAPWPPAFVQTDEPQPPQTVTTWPPEVAS
jgi:hypothetical protein